MTDFDKQVEEVALEAWAKAGKIPMDMTDEDEIKLIVKDVVAELQKRQEDNLLCAKRGLIQIAARLAMCKALNELEETCENHRAISTSKLRDIVDKVSSHLKDEAVYIRNMTNKMTSPRFPPSCDARVKELEALMVKFQDDNEHLIEEIEKAEQENNQLREQLKDSVPNGWQPIDTAPKDGESILLSGSNGRMADGFFHKRYQVWTWPYINSDPTHWMPLPAATGQKE